MSDIDINKEGKTKKKKFQKGKLVMNIDNDPERIEVVDRLVIYMIKSKKYKTKSDAVFELLKVGLTKAEAEEARKERVILARKKENVVEKSEGV